MKKRWSFALAALLLFTACQATPEADIVVRKNTEQMIEAAKTTPSAPPVEVRENAISPLYERFNIPEHYAVSIQPRSKKLAVTVDARVVLPVTMGMPTVRIRARDFTQDEVYRLFNAFCGDRVMYYAVFQKTKAQYEETLIKAQKDLAEMNENGMSDEILKEQIAWLEQQMLAAPESVVYEVCDGTMREVRMGGSVFLANRVQVDATDEEGLKSALHGRRFGAVANVYNINEKEHFEYETNSCVYYMAGRGGKSFLVLPIEFIPDESVVPAEAVGELASTPAEARATVQGFFRENGFDDLFVQGVYLAYNKDNDVTDGLEDTYGQKHAYAVVCGKAVNGVMPRLIGESWYSYVGEDAYGISWAYERCYFFVDDEGILEFNWNSPNEYVEVVAEDTALLPFEKVSEIFQKMMLVKYEAGAEDASVAKLTFHIDRVALELQRIAEQDSIDTGLLVPVWNFYGTWLYEYGDGHARSDQDRQGFPYSLLTINAIDGSIIDAGHGY